MTSTASQPWPLHLGDARSTLAGMPAGSANCIVTRAPDCGKRNYGVVGQYGHEASPGAYVETMHDVFRVLADDGTCTRQLPLGTGSRTRSLGYPGSRTRPRKFGSGTREIAIVRLDNHDRNRRRARPKGRLKPGGMWSIPAHLYKRPHSAACLVDHPLRCIVAGCKPGAQALDPFAWAATRPGSRRFSWTAGSSGSTCLRDFARLAADRLAQSAADREAARRSTAHPRRTRVPPRIRPCGYAYPYDYPGARIGGDRQIRRKARDVRKPGMQPVIFIDADQVPTRIGVIAACRAWHYRSELAPLASAAAVLGPGFWLYLACPHLIVGVAVAAPAVGVVGACAGLGRLTERVCLVSVALAADGWLAVACESGPVPSPLPQVLGIGTLPLGAPWRDAPMPARAAQPWRR
jgi:hypothetical protein